MASLFRTDIQSNKFHVTRDTPEAIADPIIPKRGISIRFNNILIAADNANAFAVLFS